MIEIGRHIYHPTHGPQIWPWWKLATLNVCRCTHDPDRLFWNIPLSYNIWLYTRWGAICCNFRVRKGVYIAQDLW